MKTFYTITVEFPTVSPLFCRRNFHVETHDEMMRATKLLGEIAGFRIVGTTINHLMSSREIIDEIDNEIDACMRAAHVAAST